MEIAVLGAIPYECLVCEGDDDEKIEPDRFALMDICGRRLFPVADKTNG